MERILRTNSQQARAGGLVLSLRGEESPSLSPRGGVRELRFATPVAGTRGPVCILKDRLSVVRRQRLHMNRVNLDTFGFVLFHIYI